MKKKYISTVICVFLTGILYIFSNESYALAQTNIEVNYSTVFNSKENLATPNKFEHIPTQRIDNSIKTNFNLPKTNEKNQNYYFLLGSIILLLSIFTIFHHQIYKNRRKV